MKPSLIIIPFSSLIGDVCDYSDQTIKILNKKGHQVLGVALGNPISIYHDFLGVMRGDFIIKKSSKNHVLKPVMFLPFQRLEFIKRINFIINIFIINFVFAKTKKTKIMWFFEPKYGKTFLSFLKKDLSIYDCVDYFSGDKNLKKENEYVIKNSDKVFVNSLTLENMYSSLREDIKKVPLGFHIPKNNFKTLRKSTKNKAICFIGSIGDRIDLNFLKRAIKTRNKDDFIFIGPIKMSPQRKKVFLKLLENKRAYWLGEVSKNELLKLVSSFDIGLIPYKKTLFNINSFPMKVMEYFYLGMPIISSNIKELERFNDHVYFPEKDGWKDLNDFLKKSEDKSVEKKKIALMNSWYKKVSLILQCLG
jgi:teichuronic acid biosynthesis glycosyltransferase TuaH